MKQLSLPATASKLLFFSLVYVAAIMPFHGIYVPLGLGIASMTVFWLLEGQLKAKLTNLVSNKYTLLFIALYLVHVVSYFYSENKQAAATDLGLKLSLLLCPLVIGTTTSLNKRKITHVLKTFVLSCLVSAIVCLVYATYQWKFAGKSGFSYADLSLFIPVGYYAMYLVFAAVLLVYDWLKRVGKFSIFHLLAILLLSAMVVLLTARAQLLAYLLILAGIGFFFFKRKYGWMPSIGIMLLLLGAFSAGVYFSPTTKRRVVSAWNEVTKETELKHSIRISGVSVRFIIWDFGKEILQENPFFGVGNGDAKDVLMQKAIDEDIPGIYKKELNFHNQYFQTAVETGLVGFGVFLLGLVAPLLVAARYNFGVYISFSLLILIGFFTESMLERQAGLIFFAFFNALLFLKREDISS